MSIFTELMRAIEVEHREVRNSKGYLSHRFVPLLVIAENCQLPQRVEMIEMFDELRAAAVAEWTRNALRTRCGWTSHE